jgi:hypothetical protein
MSNRKNWIAVTIVIFGLIMFIPGAQAQRQEFEGIQCNALTVNLLHSSPELGVSSLDQKGIIQSTHPNKLFDNWTRHSILVFKRTDEKISWNGFTKNQAPDGDFIIWEFSGDSQRNNIGKPILGTGKWKGVKGEYTSTKITKGKPIIPNTDQYCEKIVGWIELPK